MTPSRYIVARIGQAFGYFRKGQRMADAAAEMHLLREAEAHLGEEVWRNVESIETLSVEYWNLRKHDKEFTRLQEALTECQSRLDMAHQERATLLNEVPEGLQKFHDQRAEQLTELEQLAKQRDAVVEEARNVRRQFTGLKTKLEVLVKDDSDELAHTELIEQSKNQLITLKRRFEELKEERGRISEMMSQGDGRMDEIESRLSQHRTERRSKAAEAFQLIGDGNKALSSLKAEISVLDTQMRQLYGEIGRYVSRHAHVDKTCLHACSSQRNLVDIMRALRKSIALNHKLAENA